MDWQFEESSSTLTKRTSSSRNHKVHNLIIYYLTMDFIVAATVYPESMLFSLTL